MPEERNGSGGEGRREAEGGGGRRRGSGLGTPLGLDRLGRRLSLDAAAGYTHVEDSPISRDERFYAGTGAQTDVLTDGRASNQHVLVFALGGRLSF